MPDNVEHQNGTAAGVEASDSLKGMMSTFLSGKANQTAPGMKPEAPEAPAEEADPAVEAAKITSKVGKDFSKPSPQRGPGGKFLPKTAPATQETAAAPADDAWKSDWRKTFGLPETADVTSAQSDLTDDFKRTV